MATAKYGTAILEFSEHTIRLHRNLVAIAFIVLAIEWLHLPVHAAEVFGVSVGVLGGGAIKVALAGLLIYHTAMYIVNAISDVGEHEWSSTNDLSSTLQSPAQGLVQHLERIHADIPAADSRTWSQIEERIQMLQERIADLPNRHFFFIRIVKLRHRVEIGVALALALLAGLEFFIDLNPVA